METDNLYAWKRLWLPFGAKYLYDDQRFPRFSDYDFSNEKSTQIAMPLNDFDNEKCLVMIGDPGMGKSTEIITADHQGNSITKKYFLRDYSNTTELFNEIDNDIGIINNIDRAYLFLDGLDEGLLTIGKLNNAIARWLITLKSKNETLFSIIYFRVTCRSITWSEISETTISKFREVFKEENVKIIELAPLSRENLKVAVEKNNLNSSDFFEVIVENEYQNFCLDPQSFSALLKCYLDKKLIKGIQRSELFKELIDGKCIESNSEYKKSKRLTPEQRFKIASRLAAYCVLSNKTALWINETRDGSVETDLNVEELVRDEFRIESKLELIETKSDLLEVLDTTLFTLSNHESRFIFKHRAELEYLAAWHIDKIELNSSQVFQLLTSINDPMRSIPQVQEVIIWLVTLNNTIFELLTKSEPLLLLKCHRVLSISERQKLSKSLLSNSNSFDIVDSYDDEKYYHKLDFPVLAKLIKPYITKKGNIALQRTCIHIADKCKLKSLQDELLKVLEDSTNSTHIRREALEAIFSFDAAETLSKLIVFAITDRYDDPDDELKGTALRALYPRVLSTEQVLKCLTPAKRNNLYGSYKGFLDSFNSLIPDEDVHQVIEYFAKQNKEPLPYPKGSFERLREESIERAYQQLQNQRILNLVCQNIKNFLKKHIQFNSPERDEDRLMVVKSLLENWDDDMRIWYLISNGSSQLIRIEDWDWVVNLAKQSEKKEISTLAIEILSRILNYNNESHCSQYLELAYEHRDLKQFGLLVVDLDSDDAKYFRTLDQKVLEEDEELKETPPYDASQTLEDSIQKIEKGDFEEWGRFIFFLSEGVDYKFDITQFRYWKSFGETNQNRLLSCAMMFLKRYSPNTDMGSYDRLELSGYKAILYIKLYYPEYLEELTLNFWRDWLGVIIHCSLNNQKTELDENEKAIVAKCYKDMPDLFVKDLSQQVQNQSNNYNIKKIVFIIDPIIGKELLNLISIVDEIDSEYFLNLLFESCREVSEEFAWKKVHRYLSLKEVEPDERLAVMCGAKLFQYLNSKEWDKFWLQIIRKSDKAIKIFLSAIGSSETRYRDQLKSLSPKQKSNLLHWITKHFPPKEDPVHDSAYSPKSRDYVVMFRSELIRSLIEEGSVESVSALRSISDRMPNNEDFRWWLNSAREVMRRNTWESASPKELRIILGDPSKRLIRSHNELLNVLLESLERLNEKLQGNNPTAFFLWNYSSKEPTPKDENSLSDFVKMHLDYDLRDRNIIVNREVEIRRSSGKKDGERSDILVQATPHDSRLGIFSIVIETKRCYHKEIFTAMETQLKDRYLKQHKCTYGIYLVGWYYGANLKIPSNQTKKKFEQNITNQASTLSDARVELRALILDCSI